MSNLEKIEAAEWLEEDAQYLEKRSALYEAMGDTALSKRVSINAKHSAQLAVQYRKEARK